MTGNDGAGLVAKYRDDPMIRNDRDGCAHVRASLPRNVNDMVEQKSPEGMKTGCHERAAC